MEAIKIVSLTKKYKDVVAVDGLSLNVEQGELFSLLGVNGAGKTTAIKMLSCLTRPDSGDAYICGYSVTAQSAEVKRLIAVSPQQTAIAPGLRVSENLKLICGVHGMNAAESRTAAEQITEKLGLGEVYGRYAGKLSGGWQRRLSIAMALISRPRVLFLDEPTLGLDVIARSELWDLIRELRGEMTVILTTHYMEEAEALSDRVGIMRSGKLLTAGTPGEIMTAAGTDNFEQAFIRTIKGGKDGTEI